MSTAISHHVTWRLLARGRAFRGGAAIARQGYEPTALNPHPASARKDELRAVRSATTRTPRRWPARHAARRTPHAARREATTDPVASRQHELRIQPTEQRHDDRRGRPPTRGSDAGTHRARRSRPPVSGETTGASGFPGADSDAASFGPCAVLEQRRGRADQVSAVARLSGCRPGSRRPMTYQR